MITRWKRMVHVAMPLSVSQSVSQSVTFLVRLGTSVSTLLDFAPQQGAMHQSLCCGLHDTSYVNHVPRPQGILMLAACIYQQHGAIRRAGLTWADWLPVSWAAFRTACHPKILWEHGRLAMAGGIMNAAEAGAFDVTTAFAGEAHVGHR
jgi:hypothetical protein